MPKSRERGRALEVNGRHEGSENVVVAQVGRRDAGDWAEVICQAALVPGNMHTQILDEGGEDGVQRR